MRILRPPELRTEEITLRPPAAMDAAWLVDACNDAELSRWIPVMPYPYTRSDAEWFLQHAAEGWANGTDAAFFICAADSGGPLGGITLHLAASDEGLAGVGYWVHRDQRGRGVASDALRLVARWAFSDITIERLHLTTLPDNAASQRVAARVGFIREGVLRQWAPTSEGRRDAVMYSLLAQELQT